MRGLEGENPKELDTAKAVFQAAEAAEEKRPMLFGPVSPCAERPRISSWGLGRARVALRSGVSGWSWCRQETDLSAFKRGAYVGFGAFGYVQIAKHKASGQICAIKAM